MSATVVIPPRWRCDYCGGINDAHMLEDEVWLAVWPSKVGKLCLACVEFKLDRPLRMEDFSNAPINRTVKKGFEMGQREAAGGVSK